MDGTRSMARGTVTQSVQQVLVPVSALRNNRTLLDLLTEVTSRGGTPYPLIFDKIIRCLGFQHDKAPYVGMAVHPEFQSNGKYPVLNADFESVTVPGLYYAGTLGHGKDFKKSVSNFFGCLQWCVTSSA
jgi:hypothetical protein